MWTTYTRAVYAMAASVGIIGYFAIGLARILVGDVNPALMGADLLVTYGFAVLINGPILVVCTRFLIRHVGRHIAAELGVCGVLLFVLAWVIGNSAGYYATVVVMIVVALRYVQQLRRAWLADDLSRCRFIGRK